jgi:tetratricopeptide (TPR) repeat protein/predicted Ser/Thr protein kinase
MTEPTASYPESPSRGAELLEPARQWSQLLQEQGQPDLSAFLANAGDLSIMQIAAVLRADQQQRWQSGERRPAEAYLEKYPAIAADLEGAVDLIYGEFLLRESVGETPEPAEFLSRFPQYAARLEQQIDFHRALADRPPTESIDVWKTMDGPGGPGPHTPQRVPPERAPITPVSQVQTTPQDPRPAQQSARGDVPGHEIVKELGRGGMGVVYLARQLALNRLVALKMILAGGHGGPAHLARFRGEAQALARLQHPNIVQVYEVGEQNDQPFFSLEYVEGGALDRQLRKGLPEPRRAAELAATLARAMHAAHQAGVVHRDLKPANVLLGRDGTPKITDFGLAKRLDDESGQTQSGAVMGTPSYMAPEQAAGKVSDIGPPTDIYALGAILYEMLTGRPPFRGESLWDTIAKVREEAPVQPRRIKPQVPADLETICLKCLEKERARRYPTAEALADDLQRFLDSRPIQARRVGRLERLLLWRRRHPVVAALSLGLVVAVLGGGAAGTSLLVRHWQQRQQLADAGRQIGSLLDRGEQTQHDGEHTAAGDLAREALVRCSEYPALAAMFEERGRCLLQASEASRAALEQFPGFREDAFFHGTLFTGRDVPTSLARVQSAARAGLGLFFDAVGEEGPLRSRQTYEDLKPDVQLSIRVNCYQLLLLLAGAVAQRLPGQSEAEQRANAAEAVRQLRQAAALGVETRAQHKQLADCLERVGAEAEAAREKSRAEELERQEVGEAVDALRRVRAVDYFLLGDEQYRNRQFVKGAEYFEDTLRLQPEHFWASYYAGLCYLRIQRPELAANKLDVCINQRRDFLWSYLYRGYAQVEIGNKAQTEAAQPDLPEPERAQRIAKARSCFKTAALDFQRAMDLQPDNTARYSVLVHRAVLRYYEGRLLEQLLAGVRARVADRTVRLLVDMWLEGAVANLEQAIQLDPRSYQAHVDLAEVYRKQGRLLEAEAQFDQALEFLPIQPIQADLYRKRAGLRLARNDNAGALADLDKAARLEPAGSLRLADDHVLRAQYLQKDKHYREAIAALDQALRIDLDRPEALRRRSECLVQAAEAETDATQRTKLCEQATRAYDYYLKRVPAAANRAEFWRGRGLARELLGEAAGAAADYTESLKIEQDAETLAHRGWMWVWGAGDAKEALADFEKALSLRAEPPGDWYNGRGYARVKLGQYRPAVADAEEALRRGPKTPRLCYNAARIYAAAVVKVQEDPALQNQAGRELRRRYQELAVKNLAAALDLIPLEQRAAFWHAPKGPPNDPVMRSIRRTPEYENLAARYPDPGKEDPKK